jgi:hypothetical protein
LTLRDPDMPPVRNVHAMLLAGEQSFFYG